MSDEAKGGTGRTDTPTGDEVTPQSQSALEAALRADAEKRTYSGHPAQVASGEAEEEETETPAGPGEGAPIDAGLPELAEEEEAGSEAEGKGKKKAKPVTFKGKTHEEEARHRAEAEAWGHKYLAENKDLKGQVEDLKKQLEDKSAGKEAQGEETGGDKQPGVTAAAKERFQKILVQIDELDQFAPDYYEKKAELMAQLGLGQVDEATMQRLVDNAVKAQQERERAEKAEARAHQKMVDKANKLAAKLGLDMRENIAADEDGNPLNAAEYDLFWDVAARAPKGKPLEEQVKWVVREVRRLKGVAKSDLTREAAHHQSTAVLERYGEGRVPAASRKSTVFTLTDALSRAQRRI